MHLFKNTAGDPQGQSTRKPNPYWRTKTTVSYRLGLCLSGGGIRGVAHVGALRAFAEEGFRFDVFAGASAGALVGVMAAAQCPVEDMLAFWRDTRPFEWEHIAWGKPGLFNSEDFVPALKGYVRHERFEDLPNPLRVSVTAMLSGRNLIVDRGELWPFVLASASMPVVFTPVSYADEVYMDGGITDNFPLACLREDCQVVVGIDVLPLRQITADNLDTTWRVFARTLDLRYNLLDGQKSSLCDVLVVPEGIESFGIFDTDNLEDLYQLGYQTGKAAIPNVRAAMERKGVTPP